MTTRRYRKLPSRYKRLHTAYREPLTKVHLEFFSSALQLFAQYNLFLQRADPLARKVYPVTKSLLEKFCMRFIESAVMEGAEIDETMIDDEVNYLPLEETCLGFATMNLLGDLLNNGDVTDSQKDIGLKAARAFCRESARYIITKLNLSEPFWKYTVWVTVVER